MWYGLIFGAAALVGQEALPNVVFDPESQLRPWEEEMRAASVLCLTPTLSGDGRVTKLELREFHWGGPVEFVSRRAVAFVGTGLELEALWSAFSGREISGPLKTLLQVKPTAFDIYAGGRQLGMVFVDGEWHAHWKVGGDMFRRYPLWATGLFFAEERLSESLSWWRALGSVQGGHLYATMAEGEFVDYHVLDFVGEEPFVAGSHLWYRVPHVPSLIADADSGSMAPEHLMVTRSIDRYKGVPEGYATFASYKVAGEVGSTLCLMRCMWGLADQDLLARFGDRLLPDDVIGDFISYVDGLTGERRKGVYLAGEAWDSFGEVVPASGLPNVGFSNLALLEEEGGEEHGFGWVRYILLCLIGIGMVVLGACWARAKGRL
jgi:hypothetical protein